jgi:hypothetical protein
MIDIRVAFSSPEHRDRAGAVERNCSGPARPISSQPLAMSGQLAEIGNGLRSFFAGLIARLQHQPTDSADALPGINGLSVFSPVHVENNNTGRFTDAQKDFAGAQNV